MHCRTCDYPLWTIQARSCPECGEPFRPSDYEFAPNAVQFCCPHCQQCYYGTDWRGHLVPSRFECVGCGRAVEMDEMIVRPAVDGGPSVRMVDTMPWFERDRRGVVRAWLATIGAAMTRPQHLIRAVPQETRLLDAFLFMAVSNVIFLVVGSLLPAAMIGAVLAVLAGGGGNAGTAAVGLLLTRVTLVQIPIVLGGAVVAPVLWWLLVHGLLVMTGAATAPLERTGHAIFYSVGANALKAVPCDCGGMAGWIWWMVSASLMVQTAHRCSGLRASLIVIVASLLTNGLVIVGTMVAALAPVGGLGAFVPQTTAAANGSEVVRLATAIRSHAAVHGGEGPRHALELALDGVSGLTAGSFISASSATLEDDVPLGEGTLADFMLLPPNRARGVVESAAAALPADVVAHRVGDFVFTYHGADLSAADPALWTVIAWPEGTASTSFSTKVAIGRADGSIELMPAAMFPSALVAQNAYRRGKQLPPLPSPETVTHQTPARKR